MNGIVSPSSTTLSPVSHYYHSFVKLLIFLSLSVCLFFSSSSSVRCVVDFCLSPLNTRIYDLLDLSKHRLFFFFFIYEFFTFCSFITFNYSLYLFFVNGALLRCCIFVSRHMYRFMVRVTAIARYILHLLHDKLMSHRN